MLLVNSDPSWTQYISEFFRMLSSRTLRYIKRDQCVNLIGAHCRGKQRKIRYHFLRLRITWKWIFQFIFFFVFLNVIQQRTKLLFVDIQNETCFKCPRNSVGLKPLARLDWHNLRTETDFPEYFSCSKIAIGSICLLWSVFSHRIRQNYLSTQASGSSSR